MWHVIASYANYFPVYSPRSSTQEISILSTCEQHALLAVSWRRKASSCFLNWKVPPSKATLIWATHTILFHTGLYKIRLLKENLKEFSVRNWNARRPSTVIHLYTEFLYVLNWLLCCLRRRWTKRKDCVKSTHESCSEVTPKETSLTEKPGFLSCEIHACLETLNSLQEVKDK